MLYFRKLVLFSHYTIHRRSRSNTKYFINIRKYFGASYELKPTRTIFSQCARKNFENIYRVDDDKTQYHANPIFNTDMAILLKLCSFRWFFFFDQKIRAVKKHVPFQKYLMFNAFGEGCLYVLKRFLFLFIRRLYFI